MGKTKRENGQNFLSFRSIFETPNFMKNSSDGPFTVPQFRSNTIWKD